MKAPKLECDRCETDRGRITDHEYDRARDKGQPWRAARYCTRCHRELKLERKKAERRAARARARLVLVVNHHHRPRPVEPEAKLPEVPEVDVLLDMLLLVHEFDPAFARSRIETWSDMDKICAEKWAASEVAIANDHRGKRVPMPRCVLELGKLEAVAIELAGSAVAESAADELEAAASEVSQ